MLKSYTDQNFLGTFHEENYTVQRKYIHTEKRTVRLFHTKFTPKQPHSTICIIHGFGEHSMRFYYIAEFYVSKGYEVLLVDLRGFGYSGYPRGMSTTFQMQNDVIHLLKEAREDLPLFLYAHSMGGLVTIKLLLDKPELKARVSGCILTAPLINFPQDRKLAPAKIAFMKAAGQDLQDFVINSMVNPTSLTKNDQYLHNIFEDRLMLPFLSPKMGKHLFEAIDQINRKVAEFTTPVIIFHGKLDELVSYKDSQRFVYNPVMPFKRIHLFEQGFHQLQHDKQREQLLQKSIQFLNQIRNKPIFGKPDLSIIVPAPKKSIKKYIILAIIVLLLVIKKLARFSILGWIAGKK